jgi:GIY-YIG catalytic domain
MDFNTLLAGVGVAPASTALALHRPGNPAERTALRRYMERDKTLFEAYQSTHPKLQEATLKARSVMASFIAKGTGNLVFCGLYAQRGLREVLATELDAMPVYARLNEGRDWSFVKDAREKGVPGRALFNLVPMSELGDLTGRLVVREPGGRNHMRLAETTPLEVVEVLPVEDFAPPIPRWNELTLTADEVKDLPRGWAEHLRAWRGVYLIVDERDGARYVGSAYGEENLLGRWRAHVAGDHGGTVGLANRIPATFRFSILETLHPSLDAFEVIEVENTWKERLHTRVFGLNEN